MLLPIDAITLPTKDLRATVDQDALEELADSMRDNGQLQSIGVRPLPGVRDWFDFVDGDRINHHEFISNGGRFEVVFGARRFRAALLNDWDQIKAEIVDDHDETSTAKNKLIENVLRENLTPIEEAYGLVELVGDDGPNFRRLQEQTGKSREWIRNRLELVTMPDDLQQAIQGGFIGVGVAKAFAGIDDDDVRRQFLEYACNNPMTADDARRWAANADAAKTGIHTMLEHDEQLAEQLANMPYVPQLWNCFGCKQPREQTECNMLVICRSCQTAMTHGRTPGE